MTTRSCGIGASVVRSMSVVAVALVVGGFVACGDGRESPAADDDAMFVDVTTNIGIDFVHRLHFDDEHELPDAMSSGCAIFDGDGDGELDIYLLDAGRTRDDGAANRFYRRAGARYVDVTEASGLGDVGYGTGVAVGDVDNDGDLDVYVGNWGRDALYLNDGAGRFSNATKRAGIVGDVWTTSIAMFDYDVDGDLDIFVGQFVAYDPSKSCSRRGVSEYCGPTTFPGLRDKLYRNRGDGTFEDVSKASGIASIAANTLGVVIDDFDFDGDPDIYVANDGEPNHLWINGGDGTFTNEAWNLGCAVNRFGTAEASMGVASGDVDADGDIDLFMTHLFGETNTLYLNDGTSGFTDASAASGLGRSSHAFTGFGTALVDLDHDGDLDAIAANGRVYRGEVVDGVKIDGPWRLYAERNQCFLNDGAGSFEDVSEKTGSFHGVVEVSRGLAVADLDRDGDLDFVVTNGAGPARVYENRVATGHWLQVAVKDRELKRDVFGARVTVEAGERRLSRMVGASGSYLSVAATPVHFGLGDVKTVDRIEVTWPGGAKQSFAGGDVDRVVTLWRENARER